MILGGQTFIAHEEILLDRNGVWKAGPSRNDLQEITHQSTCEAFFKNLHHDEDGYFIQIGTDEKRVTIEDTAYFVRSIVLPDDGGKILLRLSDGSEETLRPESLRYQLTREGSPRLSCLVKEGTEEAKFLSQPHYELLSEAEENDSEFFLYVGGKVYTLEKKV